MSTDCKLIANIYPARIKFEMKEKCVNKISLHVKPINRIKQLKIENVFFRKRFVFEYFRYYTMFQISKLLN